MPKVEKIFDDLWKERVVPILDTLKNEYAGELRRIRAEVEALREIVLADSEGNFARSIALSKYNR
jgi:hypothetical protein